MKIVINACYGGFSLSEAGVMAYAAKKGFTIYPVKSAFSYLNWSLVPENERTDEKYREQTFNDRNITRNDEALVAIVEELDSAANGRFAALQVIEIPDDVQWKIEEYDGIEWIAEKHRTWPDQGNN